MRDEVLKKRLLYLTNVIGKYGPTQKYGNKYDRRETLKKVEEGLVGNRSITDK